jgi:NADH:ubiquinone oxidoreductase subunit 5 (subunit L)/multisubunit Na+/H+ antiporter MnhA subunit
VATALVFASMVLAWLVALRYFSLFPAGGLHPAVVSWQLPWLKAMPGLEFSIGTLLDPASLLLIVVVTTVSALVHLYSIGYMHGDPGQARYFTSLNLFTFSMLALVLAPNLIQLYVSWELVGASSFLLIGFYFQKPSAVAAAKKAFIVTRFADLGLLLGTLTLAWLGWQYLPGLQAAGMLDAQVMPGDFALLNLPAFHALVLANPGNRARPGPAAPGPAAAVHGGRGQERHVPPAYLAARCDGGADARVRPDPRRHHGGGRRLPGGPPLPRLCRRRFAP